MHLADVLDRVVEQEHASQQGDEASDAEMREIDVEEGQRDPEGCDCLDHRLHDGAALAGIHAGAELLFARFVKEPELEGLASKRLDDTDSREGLLENDRHDAGFVLHRARGLADTTAVDNHRHEASGEENEREEGELPVDVEEGEDGAKRSQGLLDEVADNCDE